MILDFESLAYQVYKPDKNMQPKAKKDLISVRTILWHVVFTGFAVNYMTRLNINIAIVSMVKHKANRTVVVGASECLSKNLTSVITKDINVDLNQPFIADKAIANKSLISTFIANELNISDDSKIDIETEFEGFEWNEFHQGLILGAYFWFHWLTQIPGGLLAQKYGTKLVFGLANFAGVLICFIIPPASYLGYEYLAVVRALQGLLTGFAWPSMHHMTAKWIPPNERSSFVSAYLGSSIGAALTYPMCGWIIDEWGWEWVFYSNGMLGTLWYIWWLLCVYDSPEEHPRISEAEKEFIVSRLDRTAKAKEKPPVPWRSIVTSVPIWMNILAQWGGIWGFFTIMTHAPQYFKIVHGWDIKATFVNLIPENLAEILKKAILSISKWPLQPKTIFY